MKKLNFALLVSAVVFATTTFLVGCTSNNNETSGNMSSGTESSAGTSDNIEETQPDPQAPTDETDSAEEDTTAAVTEEDSTASTEEDNTVETQPDPEASDSNLIAAAQKLFERACETDWIYHVGCPYNLDYNTYVENNFGWQFYLITDSSIKSLSDVEEDYYEVFSEKYGNDLGEIYMEKDGRVYALDGERGGNIYYTGSKITGIKERSDSEIVFTVENYYNGDDFKGAGEFTEKADFSVVIQADGSWRAGEFVLPY